MAQIEARTWAEFSDAGMLWWLNRILHTFGWSIVIDGESAFPARTEWLGFDDKTNDEMLAKFKGNTDGEDDCIA